MNLSLRVDVLKTNGCSSGCGCGAAERFEGSLVRGEKRAGTQKNRADIIFEEALRWYANFVFTATMVAGIVYARIFLNVLPAPVG